MTKRNVDKETVLGFGDEWSRFDQSALDRDDRQAIFDDYFDIFPWESLPPDAVGADIGCGSGRWAVLVAPRVGQLLAIDPSADALAVARRNLETQANVSFAEASVADIPVPDQSLDFAYSLGVLHHVPDTGGALREIAAKLKPGAPFLLYLYYSFENRSAAYRLLWQASNLLRQVVSRLPDAPRNAVSEVLALTVYWPLARSGALLEKLGMLPTWWPLSYYRHKAFYVLRTDARDRFGTRLEKRFSRAEITTMLVSAGFTDVHFSDRQPFWCSISRRDRVV